MKRWMVAAALMVAVGTAQAEGPLPANEKTSLERSADGLLIGIPAIALGLTFLLPAATAAADGQAAHFAGFDTSVLRMNGSPRHDLGLALLRTEAVTFALKSAVGEERPNGQDEHSFPSGHTSTTFAGAEFIRKQYGWTWGAPAYLAAAFVGWSRVETHDHWAQDVIVGAAIGIGSNHDLPTRWGDFSIAPSFVSSPAETAPGVRLEFKF